MKPLRQGSVPAGYKQTEVGAIPDDWEAIDLSCLCTLQRGFDITEATRAPGAVPVYSSSGLSYFHNKAMVNPPGVVTGRKGILGKVFLINEPFWPHDTTLWVKDFKGNHPAYVALVLQSFHLERLDAATSVPTLNRHSLAGHLVPLPPAKAEQKAIAETLSNADALIESLEQLLGKKRQLKQGAMQELLTGKKRLPGFSGEWGVKSIAEIATPTALRNASGEKLPVLTCSKHLGFVDSLGFFKNQVFSKDLSTYKVIRRGEIGYPANHIEEGSIGLQNLYDMALVSPIYVVFAVAESTNSFFLHRLLKLDSYRQKFKAATTSSVERRGSLRWPAFSEITVLLPSLTEQTAISAILSDMDAEIAALEAKLAKARQLKQGMMQELLTGRIRLIHSSKGGNSAQC